MNEDELNPRMNGMLEHIKRASYFLELGNNSDSSKGRHWLFMAAIYSCRAFTELMLDYVERYASDALRPNIRKVCEADVCVQLPYYVLIERIRIHDFHRFGVAPPDSEVFSVASFGPVKVHGSKGSVSMMLSNTGPVDCEQFDIQA